MSDDLASAQADMRQGYFGGAAGMAASAAAWLVAAGVALRGSPEQAVWALLVGGMFIHPAGMLIARLLGRSGTHTKGNPLGLLAGASTVWLIACLPLAFAASRLHVEWFFPAMLLVIGSRYLVFHTLYGDTAFWPCGLALVATGCLLGTVLAPPALSALAGGGLEAAFALGLGLRERARMAAGVA